MSLFCCRSKFNKFFRSPISNTIVPLNSLKDKSRLENLIKRPRAEGIGPVNQLFLRLNSKRFFKLPSSLWMEPLIRLEEIFNDTN